MAIILDKRLQPSTTDNTVIFNSHQNRIIEFHDDTLDPADIIYAQIDVPRCKSVRIQPYRNGYFSYNLKYLLQKFISIRYEDNESLELGGNVSYSFSDFLSIITIQIITNQSYEINTDMSELLISLRVLQDMTAMDYVCDEANPISLIGNNITWFDGYPFEFTMFGKGNKIYDANDVEIATINNAARIMITDGYTKYHGLNGRTFLKVKDSTGNLLYNISTEQKKCDGGIYIKWLSLNGTYKYWLFNQRHKEEIRTKDAGHYLDTFRDDNTNNAKFQSFGKKESVKIRTLKASRLKPYERDYIMDIIRSPRVYIYTGTQGQVATLADFKTVEIVTNSLISNDFGKTSDIQIQIKEYLNDLTV